MRRFVVALTLSLAVAAAPISIEICQAECATRATDAATHSAGAAVHHSCHAEAPSSGPSVAAVHGCGHTNEMAGGDRPERGMALALAIVPDVVTVDPTIHAAAPRRSSFHVSPPPLVALASQLRV